MKPRRRAGPLLAGGLALIGGWHLLLRGQGRGVPITADEGEYAMAARAWSEGGLPYRDVYSQKPPLIFLVYRLAGAVSSSPVAPRALASLAGIAALLALFFAAPAAWSAPARLAGPAAFAALAALPIGDYGFIAGTETFVNLFAALSSVALLRGAPFLAGLAAGAALSSKQTALWTLLGFGALAVWTPRGVSAKRAGLYAGGAAAIPVACALYFAARGDFADYWTCVWSGNARYAAVLLAAGALGGQLAWFATTLLPRLLAFLAPALGLTYYALRGRAAGAARPLETLCVVWLGGAVAGALTGLFLFPHYFLALAPALALGAACGVERLPAKRRVAAVAVLALWPALLAPRMIFWPDARARSLSLLYPNPLFETQTLGQEIARRAAPDDRLHVFGYEGALFTYSGLRPATRQSASYALTLFPEDGAAWRAELKLLSDAPPRFVVWSCQPLSTMIASQHGADYRDALKRFLINGYAYAGSVRVSDAPALPVFEAAAPGEPPPFADEDRLLLFTRRGL